MARDEEPADLARTFAEIARTLLGAGSVEHTLERIVDLAVGTVEGCEYAGLLLVNDGQINTRAASDEPVRRLDRLQCDVGEGPCLDAIRDHETFEVADLARDPRWPAFTAAAVGTGVSSLLAFPLFVDDENLGALNLYSTRPSAFTEESLETGLIFASHAAVALSSAQGRAGDREVSAGLQAALDSRDVIGQAKGILMARRQLTADQAFDVLRRASQRLNQKLRDVAQQVVETGESPEGEQ